MSVSFNPASAKNTDALAERVRAAVDQALTEQRLVGAVVFIARDGQLVHRHAAGFADRETQRPMREDAIFRFSSLTKPIVSAAAMALVEQEKLSLNDAVTCWLPQFRPQAADLGEVSITVRHLLTHTAGLTYSFLQPAEGTYLKRGVSDGLDRSGLSIDEELRRLAAIPLSYAPGAAWGYSLAVDVLGEILSRVLGMPLPEVVERLVTRPLEMRDTGFSVRDHGRLVVPYVDGNPPRRMADPDVVRMEGGAGIRFSPSRIFDSDSFVSGGVGMVGTAPDFLKFLEALRNGGHPILRAETVEAMMTNQIGELRINVEPTPSWGFGFGGAVLMDPALANVPQAEGTWKWGGVYGHHWYVDGHNRLCVVAMTNTACEGMSGRFVHDLMRAVYGRES